MKKLLISSSLFIVFFNIVNAQQDIKRQYQAKLNEFSGNVEVKIRSEDIVEYRLEIFNESGYSVFKQDGFAINPELKMLKGYGLDSVEEIEREDGKLIPAPQYFELCNCKEHLTIKVAKDNSLVKIDCSEILIQKIFGKKVNSNQSKQTFGNFYLKK